MRYLAMNATPPSFGPRGGRAGPRLTAKPSAGANATAMRWSALTEAGKVVALLAGISSDEDVQQVKDLPAQLRDCPAWKREFAENAISDLAAIMEPGLSALMAVNARGADPKPAAQSLWREFSEARSAILDLMPKSSPMGPKRSA